MLNALGFSTTPTLELLKKWNVWLAVIYALQAVAVLVVGSAQLVPLTASFLTVDSLLSTTTGSLVLAPATHHLFDLNLLQVSFVVLALLALVHISQATWYRGRYEAQLRANHNDARWATYGLSASLTFIVLAVLAGLNDISLMLLLLILGIILHAMCAWVERSASLRGRVKHRGWFGYGILTLAGLAMWLIVLIFLIADNVYGVGHIPGRVYWLALTAAVTALVFATRLAQQLRTPKTGNRYRLTEKNYMLLTLVTSSLLVWQIVAGTMQ